MRRLVRTSLIASAAALLALCLSSAAVAAPGVGWSIDSVSYPTNFAAGSTASADKDKYLLTVTNTGSAETSGPITVSDTLPAGVTLDGSPSGWLLANNNLEFPLSCSVAAQMFTCTATVELRPGEAFFVKAPVDVAADVSGTLTNQATVAGGGAATSASTSETTAVNPLAPPFEFLPGAAGLDSSITTDEGSPDTQAGSHPYQLTTLFDVPTGDFRPGGNIEFARDDDIKDVTVNLPQGLVVDPSATPTRCTESQLEAPQLVSCPASSQVGTVTAVNFPDFGVTPIYAILPLYNMVPPPGTPAELAFYIRALSGYVHLIGSLRTGSDYGDSATTSGINTEAAVVGVQATLWGDPSDPSHNAQRGRCAEGLGSAGISGCPPVTPGTSAPFLTMPSACSGPLTLSASADTWEEPGNFVFASALTHDTFGNPVGVTGCDQLAFTPSVAVGTDTGSADAPSGLQFGLHMPQNESPGTLAEATLKQTVVTLPAGMTVNPAAANGLEACSPAEVALTSPAAANCPDASKIGSVEADTPLLNHPIDGGVYLASQEDNPFGSLLAIYIAIDDPATGVVIKLAGHIVADPQTGQLTTVVDNIPEQPLSDVELSFFGGPRAALVNPDACGSYGVSSQLTPWSRETAVEPTSGFEVTGSCHGPQFSPSFMAGTVSPQAGAFSPFGATFARSDEDQALGAVSVQMPPGLLGILKGVERCPEPQASQGVCGQGSLIGHTTVSAGAGPDPVSVSGQVFLTGPYKGGPFGLSVVVPAAVGPFNLGNVVVRAAIDIDPHTARITVVSDPLPTILQGIPLLVQKVNISVDRPGFIFNPTSCEPLSVTGTLSSAQGVTAAVSSHFQAANCAALPFKPTFSVSTQGKASKQNGASLDVKVTSSQGQANIGKVAVSLPKQLPSRLTTIQQACPEATFAANPASCPAGSNIGTATAKTPVLANPVSGPAYLVSHGGAAFPNLVIILQGENVTLQLVGSIDIKKGVTSSAFESVPDAPIETFELDLPQGPHSALTTALPAKAKYDLCGTSLTMPTTLTGQNGAHIQQSTKIAVTGCPKAKPKKKAKRHPKAKAKKGSHKRGK
jgi:hypothetical protein